MCVVPMHAKLTWLCIQIQGMNTFLVFRKTQNQLTLQLDSMRLKKINPMSQSCHAHLFFGARLIQQNSSLIFFARWIFFSSFLWLVCQKIQEKIWQTQWNTLNNKLLQLLCSALYLVHPKSSSIFPSCDRLKSDTFAAQEKKKKKKTLKKPHLGQVFQSVTSFET